MKVEQGAIQAVLDAAVAILRLRQEALAAHRPGAEMGVQIVATGDGPALTRWMMGQSHRWEEFKSTRSVTQLESLRASMPNNRVLLDRGLRMTSYFDYSGTDVDARKLLIDEERPTVYFFTVAPVHLKIVDQQSVLMHGPLDRPSILELRSTRAVAAAMTYWRACAHFARPCVPGPEDPDDTTALTSRQHLILELLRRGGTDEAIARLLHLSRRTIQLEVAVAMKALGAESRFSLGYAYAHSHDTP